MTVFNNVVRMLAAVIPIFGTSACLVSRGVEVSRVAMPPREQFVLRTPVKAQLIDGSIVLFPAGISLTGTQLLGDGWRYVVTLRDSTQVKSVQLDSLVGMETFHTKYDAGRTLAYSVATVFASMFAVMLAAAALCAVRCEIP